MSFNTANLTTSIQCHSLKTSVPSSEGINDSPESRDNLCDNHNFPDECHNLATLTMTTMTTTTTATETIKTTTAAGPQHLCTVRRIQDSGEIRRGVYDDHDNVDNDVESSYDDDCQNDCELCAIDADDSESCATTATSSCPGTIEPSDPAVGGWLHERTPSKDDGKRNEMGSGGIISPRTRRLCQHRYQPDDDDEDGRQRAERQPFELLGYDLSSLPPQIQFLIAASGVFVFTVVYGYLQELLSVHILGREYALFFATCQFGIYSAWAYYLKTMGGLPSERSHVESGDCSRDLRDTFDAALGRRSSTAKGSIPLPAYLGLSLLRAVDMASTNLAMKYINYPAKTMLKSARVVFTMFMGIVIGRKRYTSRDYITVGLLVSGLLVFFEADSRADSANFHPLGVILLIISLLCDGAVSNFSEQLMNRHHVSQDEYLFRLYTISFAFMFLASQRHGEFCDGLRFMLRHGTIADYEEGPIGGFGAALVLGEDEARGASWTPAAKISALLLFGTTGILGSSCASGITKHFGALAMSVTSTVRKATTLFLSFALFPHECTTEHVTGIAMFFASLVLKTWNGARKVKRAEVTIEVIKKDNSNCEGRSSTNPRLVARDYLC